MARIPKPYKYLLIIKISSLLSNVGKRTADLTGGFAETYHSIVILANGFIISSMIWGAAIAYIIDHKLHTAAFYFFAAAILSLFGIIHSPLDNGGLFFPWQINSSVPVTLFAGYLATGLMLNYVGFHNKRFGG